MSKTKKNTTDNNKKMINSSAKFTRDKTFSALVAIGSSAGGLESLEKFFKHMSPDSNMAFIVITHLSSDHISLLVSILQNYTTMKVVEIVNAIPVLPNHVYVLQQPRSNLMIEKNILYLVDIETNDEPRLPIDFFLRSLAIDQGEKAICIILSGTGSDGTAGLRVLREKGGLVIVQSAKSARYDGMPKSAVNTGLVDYILPSEKMPEFLLKYLHYINDKSVQLDDRIPDEIQQVLTLLYNYKGHDFSLYKPNTIFRRIQKRLGIHQLESLSHYIEYLYQHPHEIDILFKELLINVTNFFRDPEAFDRLKAELQMYLKDKSQDHWMRIWVPGCATGEEAYSIGIIVQECMDSLKRYFNVQIFGTDIDDEAIEIARSGVYAINIVGDVSADRLNRFFIKDDCHYKIVNDIRKMIIFAEQNIIKDPPFTKLDLISCRNLLIYLSAQLQKKVLPLFHYSLKPKGLLFLGSSETIGNSNDLFDILDRRWKLFGRKGGNALFQAVIDFPTAPQRLELKEKPLMENIMHEHEPQLSQLIETILLENYAPACVIIDEKDTIVYIYGRTARFLEFPPGAARLNVVDMVRTEIKMKLASAIRKVSAQNKEMTINSLQIKEGNEFKYINLKIRPINELQDQHLLLIIFEDVLTFEQIDDIKIKRGSKGERDKKIGLLEQELKYTKESLQTTIEELETSNEELKSSNEELQSTNEELQSTNEEIETSKEELQSLNEELTTVNAELETRIEQLSSANDDIKNLLDNTEIATIFLDKDLCIKRYTPRATEIINFIPTDTGRPIGHIVSNLNYEKLVEDAHAVLKNLESRTTEVKSKDGRWYIIRIIPYRTVTNIIDGVVITFVNIHAQKEAEQKIVELMEEIQHLQHLNNIFLKTHPNPIILLSEKLKIISANNAFCNLFNARMEEVLERSIYKLNNPIWNIVELKKLLEELPPEQFTINEYEISSTQDGKSRLMLSLQRVSLRYILLIVNRV